MTFPSHQLLGAVRPLHHDTILLGESRNGLSRLVQQLDGQRGLLATDISVDKEVCPVASERPCQQRAFFLPGANGYEPIPAKHGQAGSKVGIMLRLAVVAPAHVEVKRVAHHQRAAGHRLHIARIPSMEILADGQERLLVRAVPMETVAAEPYQHLVALLHHQAVARIVLRPLPDGEVAQHQVLISHSLVVVDLRTDVGKLRVARVVLIRVEPVTDKLVRMIVIHPMGQTNQHFRILMRQVVTRTPILRVYRLQRQHILPAEGIVVGGAAVIQLARQRLRAAPMDAVCRILQLHAHREAAVELHDKHLEPPCRILLLLVQQDGHTVMLQRIYNIRARHRASPMTYRPRTRHNT